LHAITFYEENNLSLSGSNYQIGRIHTGAYLAIMETIMSSNCSRALLLKHGTVSVNYFPNKIKMRLLAS
jgi:hypothetical protein